MLTIGVTGGIASGKSTVCRVFEKRGAVIINADAVGHAVLNRPEIQARLVEAFGREILTPDGEIDRSALGRIVFRDAASRERLNAIMHPSILDEIRRRIAAMRAAGDDRVIVVEAPVLIEARGTDIVDLLVVVTAPAPMRLQRLMERSGLSEDAARQRIDAQISDEERLRWADEVIENTGSIETLAQKAGAWWDRIASRDL